MYVYCVCLAFGSSETAKHRENVVERQGGKTQAHALKCDVMCKEILA